MKLNKIFLATVLGLTMSAVSAYSQQRKHEDQYEGEVRVQHVERHEQPEAKHEIRQEERHEIRHEIRQEERHEIRREERHEVNVAPIVPDSVSSNHIHSSGDYMNVPTTGASQDEKAVAAHTAPPSVEVTSHQHATKWVAPPVAEAPTQKDIEVTNYNGAAEIERKERLARMEKDFGPAKP